MRKAVLILVLVLVCVSVAHADAPDPDPDPGFWYGVFWGTEAEPGVFRSIWDWICDGFTAGRDALVAVFWDCLPSSVAEDFTSLKTYFEVANAWLPLDFGFMLLFAYWGFVAVFSAVKLILKLIPTVG